MKIKLALSALLALTMIAATALVVYAGVPAGSGVMGSMHDMQTYASGVQGAPQADNELRTCVFCHTPHQASTDGKLDYNPMWNHAVTSQTYQPYVSATFSVTAVATDTLTGSSRLCMSCHDGSIAIDEHGGEGAQAGVMTLAGTPSKVVGSTTSASTDHPIGINYVNIYAANPTKYKNPVTTTWINGTQKIAANLEAGGLILTCATCHDVHNKKNVTQLAGTLDGKTPNWLLRSRNSGSAICRSCHTM